MWRILRLYLYLIIRYPECLLRIERVSHPKSCETESAGRSLRITTFHKCPSESYNKVVWGETWAVLEQVVENEKDKRVGNEVGGMVISTSYKTL